MRDLLRGEIISGRSGRSQLPSGSELILEYAVGPNITRGALDLLRTEGLIERIQGSGTFALADKAAHRFDRFDSINDSVSRSRSVRGRVLTTSTIIACRPIADQLRLERGSLYVMMQYTLIVDEVSFSVSTSYLPPEVGARVADTKFTGDFYLLLEYLLLESAGFDVAGGEQAIEAITADDLAADQLDIDFGARC
jgi:GntR family transcriptional regulator